MKVMNKNHEMVWHIFLNALFSNNGGRICLKNKDFLPLIVISLYTFHVFFLGIAVFFPAQFVLRADVKKMHSSADFPEFVSHVF